MQGAEVERERVAPVQVDVVAGEEVGEVGLERPVDLDGVDVPRSVGESPREHAEPGPDLQHDVVRTELGESLDHGEDVRVGEEVLAELLLGAHAHGRRKAAAAFASIRAASASGWSPRASARTATVWRTFAGSLRQPRTACGAR